MLGGSNLFVDGAAAGSLLLVAALAQAVCRSWDPARAQAAGLAGLAAGLLGLIAAGFITAGRPGSAALLFAAMAVAGCGQGLAFMGGLRRINEIAPAGARAGIVSLFYVVSYAGSGLVTVGVGLLATLLGLTVSVRWFGAVLAAACLLMLSVLRPATESGQRFLLLSLPGYRLSPPGHTVCTGTGANPGRLT